MPSSKRQSGTAEHISMLNFNASLHYFCDKPRPSTPPNTSPGSHAQVILPSVVVFFHILQFFVLVLDMKKKYPNFCGQQYVTISSTAGL